MKINTSTKSKLDNGTLDKLILDKDNPRFAELYDGSSNEDDLIEYLLYTESGEEIAKAIQEAKEFYPDRPLWVLKDGKNFLVKDGNRRCAAIKALQNPSKYGLSLKEFKFNELPILIYENKEDLDKRILQEHTSNLFKEWDRIAKALKVYELYCSGGTEDFMKEIDSTPSELIKLASFYYEAVKIKGDNLRRLLRRGRGKTGGKTIIFERLFKYSDSCGYKFQRKPSYAINITNQDKFSKYISALVDYLEKNPNTTHSSVDNQGKDFLANLEDFGFDISTKEASQKDLFNERNKVVDEDQEEINIKQEKKEATPRKTASTKTENILFGRKLFLKQGQVNDLYCAVCDFYEGFKNENANGKVEKKLAIIGMSLRLILDVAGREIMGNKDDQAYKKFLSKSKKEMSMSQEDKAFISVTESWLSEKENLEAIFAKYAHGSIQVDTSNILKLSKIVADILEFYFKKES